MSRKKSKARKLRNELKKQGKMRSNLIAVYDGFRKGGPYQINMGDAEAEFIGTYDTEPDYKMVRLPDGECGMTNKGTTSVRMEVYRISDKLLNKFDLNYEYTGPLMTSNKFERVEIPSPFGRLMTWIYNNDVDLKTTFYEGDFIEYLKEEKRLDLSESYKIKEKKVFTDIEQIFNT